MSVLMASVAPTDGEKGMKAAGKAGSLKASVEAQCGQFTALKAAVLDFAGAPVVGPLPFLVLHRIFALFTVGFFLFTIITALPSFSAKVTTADVEFLADYQLPDMYLCMDGGDMKHFLTKKTQKATVAYCEKHIQDLPGDAALPDISKCPFEMMEGADNRAVPSAWLKGTYSSRGVQSDGNVLKDGGKGGAVMQFRSGMTSDIRCGAYNMAYYNVKEMKEDTGNCPVEKVLFSANYHAGWTTGEGWKKGAGWKKGDAVPASIFPDRLGFHSWLKDDEPAATVTPGIDGIDEMAGLLADLLPSESGETKDADNKATTVTVPGYCFRNVIKPGAKSYYENNKDLVLGMSVRIFPSESVSLARAKARSQRLIALASLDCVLCPLCAHRNGALSSRSSLRSQVFRPISSLTAHGKSPRRECLSRGPIH